MRTEFRVLCMAAATVAALAAPATAQDWREMSSSRQVDGENRVDVLVRYGAGEFRVRPADRGTLYRMNLTYDDDQFDPVTRFDGRRLELGVESEGRNVNIRGRNRSEFDLSLGRGLEMDLTLEFGAVEADLDLGGLSLRSLELRTGASESRVQVSERNPVRMERATFEVGAADFEAHGLANLNADELELNAGVGSVTLDFSGGLQGDMDVHVNMGLGSLDLRLPRNVGVRIEKDSFLASLDTNGMVKRGDAWYTSNWDDADQRIRIDVSTAFGSVDVHWIR